MSFDFLDFANEAATLGRIAAAMLLGALIGAERELASRPAGVRTHMLVSGAAALFTLLGQGLVEAYQAEVGTTVVRSDPVRLIEPVVTGISFLGAGTIIRSGPRDVRGLTTAASLLLSAGVGIATGVSRWVLAVGVVLLALTTLHVVRRLEGRVGMRDDAEEGYPDDGNDDG